MSESRQERRERERREELRRERERSRRRGRTLGRGATRERAPARKKRRRQIGGIIALIILLLIGFTVFRIWFDSRPGAADPIIASESGEFAEDERVNILFLGTNGGLSDTIMLFSLDLANKRLDEISIPRDTYYARPDFPGAAYQKINAVYSTEGYEGISKAVSDVLGGIPIHYYAELGDDGVKRIVDAMGGIEMNVPIDMDYEDPDQDLYIHLKAGQQRLGGDQAVQYLRFRSGYANADLGRVSAQQEFLKAVVSQSISFNLPAVLLAAQSEVKTNMSATAAAGLAAQATGMSDGSFRTHTIPGTTGTQNGASYVFHDAEGTKALMSQIYAETPPESQDVPE